MCLNYTCLLFIIKMSKTLTKYVNEQNKMYLSTIINFIIDQVHYKINGNTAFVMFAYFWL